MPPPCRTCLATVPYAPTPRNNHLYFQVEVTDYGPGFLPKGGNTLIVPEGLFYSTKFYTLLNSTDQANVTTNFSFLPTDATNWTAPGNDSASAAYIVSLIVVKLTDSQAQQLVETLWYNDTGANASGLWSMSNSYPLYLSGFPLPVVEMAPHHYTSYPKHEPGKSFSFWEAVVDVLVKGTVYVLSGQAFYDGLVWISKQLGLDRDWNINLSWDDIVGAVTGFFSFFFNFIIEMIKAGIERLLNPLLIYVNDYQLQLIASIETNSSTITDDNPNNDDEFNNDSFVKNLLDAIYSGQFFLLMTYALIAFQVFLLTLAAILTFAVPGGGPVITQILIRILLSVFIGKMLMAATTSAILVLYTVLPEGDPFWREGVALSVLGLGAILINRYAAYPITKTIDFSGDIKGLVLAIIGLFIQVISLEQTGNWAIFLSGLGLIIAAVGFILTMLPDNNDKIKLNPFRYIEETIAGIGLAYSIFGFRKTLCDEGIIDCE